MAVKVEEHEGTCWFEVYDVFRPEDANHIEVVVESLPYGTQVLVDFRHAREKHLLALWLLALAAQRVRGRYRMAGLTGADARFLAMMGAPDARGGLLH